MVVDAFIVLAFDGEPGKAFFTELEVPQGDVNLSDYIFHETGVVIGMLRDILFIRPFENAVEARGCHTGNRRCRILWPLQRSQKA